MWTARELFTIGRKFKILLGPPPLRLSHLWIVTRQSSKSCSFRDAANPADRPRHLSWKRLEEELARDRVRWHSSVPRGKWVSSAEVGRRLLAAAQQLLSK